MSDVAHTHTSYIWMSHVSHMNESRRTHTHRCAQEHGSQGQAQHWQVDHEFQGKRQAVNTRHPHKQAVNTRHPHKHKAPTPHHKSLSRWSRWSRCSTCVEWLQIWVESCRCRFELSPVVADLSWVLSLQIWIESCRCRFELSPVVADLNWVLSLQIWIESCRCRFELSPVVADLNWVLSVEACVWVHWLKRDSHSRQSFTQESLSLKRVFHSRESFTQENRDLSLSRWTKCFTQQSRVLHSRESRVRGWWHTALVMLVCRESWFP